VLAVSKRPRAGGGGAYTNPPLARFFVTHTPSLGRERARPFRSTRRMRRARTTTSSFQSRQERRLQFIHRTLGLVLCVFNRFFFGCCWFLWNQRTYLQTKQPLLTLTLAPQSVDKRAKSKEEALMLLDLVLFSLLLLFFCSPINPIKPNQVKLNQIKSNQVIQALPAARSRRKPSATPKSSGVVSLMLVYSPIVSFTCVVIIVLVVDGCI
jgi:hypothetical protein